MSRVVLAGFACALVACGAPISLSVDARQLPLSVTPTSVDVIVIAANDALDCDQLTARPPYTRGDLTIVASRSVSPRQGGADFEGLAANTPFIVWLEAYDDAESLVAFACADGVTVSPRSTRRVDLVLREPSVQR